MRACWVDAEGSGAGPAAASGGQTVNDDTKAADRGGNLSILMYHQVGEFPPMRGHRSTYCHVRRFAAQMRYLHRFRYRVLRMDEALACLRGERPLPSRAVVLTFDDGYENFYRYAYPELQRHGFPAMVYLLSGLIGRPASWFARDGRDTPPLMTGARIRGLRAQGVDFGSHGRTHQRLAEVAPALMRDEVVRSRAELEDLLGEPVRHFCYPYGSYDAEVARRVAEAGYVGAVTCRRGSARPGAPPFELPRKAISYGDSLVGVFWKLHRKH